MKAERPVNLALNTMRFPVMAIASILHRLSGIGIFILLPYILFLLHQSLSNEEGFQYVQNLLNNPIHKVLMFLFLAAIIYHILAGIRHIIMDMGFGETLQSGRFSATAVIIAAFILTLLAGIWLW